MIASPVKFSLFPSSQGYFYSAFIMQMYSRNALRWVIPAILLFPLPYNAPLKVFNISELRGVMIRMCPGFPVHYLAPATEPNATGANGDLFHTLPPCQPVTRCSDSLGPTVHAHAQSICLCLSGCCWKALVKHDVPIKICLCHGESDGETEIYSINEAMTKRWVWHERQNNRGDSSE